MEQTPATDTLTVRIVVTGLVALAITGMVATTFLLWADIPADRVAIVTSLAGPAVGGLVGILATTRSVPQPVEPVESADNPLDPLLP